MATITCIRIPSGRSVPVKQYAAAWKQLLTVDPSTRVPKWDHFDTDAGDVLREMRAGMHDRINRKDPGYPKGRKSTFEYQTELLRLRQFIGNRVRMHRSHVPRILGSRVQEAFAHRTQE